jgi:capsular exopolysaccharide synthesis family protein
MSRIQDILNKAERDGTARRTRSVAESVSMSAAAVAPPPPPAIAPPEVVTQARPAAPPPVWTPPTDVSSVTAVTPAGHDAARTGRLDPHLVAALAPASLAAEQYRSLRTRIKRAEAGRSVRTILVTSPNKGDGKSLTAANLALTMAQEFNQRVLLVDADLRRPSVNHLFGRTSGPGLSDVLMGGADLDAALVPVSEHHLTLLPAGAPPGQPAELLGSSSMRRVLDALRGRFDRILIDMPPVAPLADVHIMAPMSDGILMIVRAGITPRPAIERALSGLDMGRVLGLVLNEAGAEGQDASNYADYGYLAG